MAIKHVVMFSGGIGSFVTAEMVVKEFGTGNTVLLFADTLAEDKDLYRFNADVSRFLNVPITRICDGRTPWEAQKSARYAANSRTAHCSEYLKRGPMGEWVKSHFTPSEVVCYVGIDFTEKHRMEFLIPKRLPYIYKAPMVDRGIMLGSSAKIRFCTERGIQPPLLYRLGFVHNNCGGACPKAGMAQWAMVYKEFPRRYQEEEEQQEKLFREVPGTLPFLKKTTNGETVYLCLKDYRRLYLEKDGVPDENRFDFGGCGCALEDNP